MTIDTQDECVWTTKTDWRRAVSRNEANSLRQRVEELEEQLQHSRENTVLPHLANSTQNMASQITSPSFPSDPSTSTSDGRSIGSVFPPPHPSAYQPAFLPQQYYPAYALEAPYMAGPPRPSAPSFNEIDNDNHMQGRPGPDPSLTGYQPPNASAFGSRPVGEQNGRRNAQGYAGMPRGQESNQASNHSASPWMSHSTHSSSGNQRRGSDPPEDIEDLMVRSRDRWALGGGN